MSWQLLDDLEILYRLKESTVTCRRGLFLNDPNKPPQTTVDIQAFYKMSNLERIDTPYPIKLEIHAYDTTPLAAVVLLPAVLLPSGLRCCFGCCLVPL